MKIDIKNLNEFSYEAIEEGRIFEFKRKITDEDMQQFAKLTGNYNPLHISSEYAREKGYKDKIVYGMLLGSLFSTLVGMYCPGKLSLCVSQALDFRSYLLPGQDIIVRGEILKKYDSIKMVVIKTSIISKNKVIVSGEVRVKLI